MNVPRADERHEFGNRLGGILTTSRPNGRFETSGIHPDKCRYTVDVKHSFFEDRRNQMVWSHHQEFGCGVAEAIQMLVAAGE